MEGVKIWAGNPLDAFREEDQEAYLDFAYDGVLRAGPAAEAEVVVVSTDSRLALEQAVGGYLTAKYASRYPAARVWAYRLLVVVVIGSIIKIFFL